jgi:hypothetical protein
MLKSKSVWQTCKKIIKKIKNKFDIKKIIKWCKCMTRTTKPRYHHKIKTKKVFNL